MVQDAEPRFGVTFVFRSRTLPAAPKWLSGGEPATPHCRAGGRRGERAQAEGAAQSLTSLKAGSVTPVPLLLDVSEDLKQNRFCLLGLHHQLVRQGLQG